MLQSSLVQASVATMQNPMGCSLPRLSVSRPASMVASMEAGADGSALLTVMKWKTVLAVFVVVVIYLVAGGLAFRALEQPFERNQKDTITAEKAAFLQKHPCVTPDELEILIKVTFFLFYIKRFTNDIMIFSFCTESMLTTSLSGLIILENINKTICS